MSNYTKTTNFAAKDSLPSGNAAKIVKGAEIDTEFNNIATASATKANANNAALTGTTVFETLSDGTIAITGWVDEDNMSSDSAVLIPTQQSVKAYVDSQVTAQDLDVTDGSNSIDIDLDSESLGILGGTGIDSTASGTGVTLAIDSTVTTLTGTQTLSNKTLTTPVISGALTTNSTIDGRDVAVDGTKLDGIESGATADQTAAEIKTAYESNANTNAFTDADESKLDGIEASADVTDTTNVTAAGALMDSELTNITAVKALNQGVATGDSPTFAAVNAPLTGNVTGNLTGNVTGNVTGDLTGDVTGNVAGNLTGSVLTAAQTNITSVGTLGALTVSGDVTVDTNTLKVDSTNNRVGILNASPDVTLDIGTATDAVHIPTGTTAQRPTADAGYFRYNSELAQFEGYSTEWLIIGNASGTTPADNSVTSAKLSGDLTTPGALTVTGALTVDTNTLVVDATNNRVGVGTASPDTTLHLQTPSGTKSEINFAQTAVTNYRIGVPASTDALVFTYGASTERLRIDAIGNVGIGTSSPSAPIEISRSNAGIIQYITNTGSTQAYTAYGNSDNPPWSQDFNTPGGLLVGLDSDETGIIYQGANKALRFGTNAAERMRIDSSGRLLINTTSILSGSAAKLQVLQTVTNEWSQRINNNAASPYGFTISYASVTPNNADNHFLYLTDSTSVRFGVYSNGGILNYSGNNVNLSDRRAKKDITLHTDNEWNCVKAWEIVDYRYNEDADDSPAKIGVIAQQIQEHCPDLVNVFQKQADAVEEVLGEDGEVVTEAKAAVEERIGVNEAQMMWKVTKALQEAMTRIETLEAKVQTLENN